jgi:hypothetical protein
MLYGIVNPRCDVGHRADYIPDLKEAKAELAKLK